MDESMFEAGPATLTDAVPSDATVARRYREQSSPLVRDGARGWRTGRIDRVVGGDFDFFG